MAKRKILQGQRTEIQTQHNGRGQMNQNDSFTNKLEEDESIKKFRSTI